MPQTSVASTLVVGQIGQLAYDSDADLLARGYPLVDATSIAPGRGVVVDVTNDSIKLPSGGGQKFAGVAFDNTKLPIETTTYVTGKTVPVLRRGQVWVATSEAVDAGDDVYLQHTAGTGAAGTFRTDNDGGSAAQVVGAQFTGTFSSGKAALYVNLPQ